MPVCGWLGTSLVAFPAQRRDELRIEGELKGKQQDDNREIIIINQGEMVRTCLVCGTAAATGGGGNGGTETMTERVFCVSQTHMSLTLTVSIGGGWRTQTRSFYDDRKILFKDFPKRG